MPPHEKIIKNLRIFSERYPSVDFQDYVFTQIRLQFHDFPLFLLREQT